ncbi:protein of unknown function [Candidatus Methylomirabilis oxygeniifera]|uniref:Uncharacterized protein n=1 Tax=Methylomirabilis oxygeniifera TaxID=671143 RepID=D5MIT2_METO1|nr:protein of unknown function [Candidatus Methylomirabilis oxyfera]
MALRLVEDLGVAFDRAEIPETQRPLDDLEEAPSPWPWMGQPSPSVTPAPCQCNTLH